MTEKVKITDEELKKVNKIQVNANTIFTELGQVTVQTEFVANEANKKIDELDEYKKKLMEQYNELQKEETEFIKDLREKYGDGELNSQTGEFTSVTK